MRGVRADLGLVAETLAELSAIGPYYAISTGPEPGSGPGTNPGSGVDSGSGSDSGSTSSSEDDGGWRPLSELVTDTGALRAKIEDYQRRLGAEEVRVAASVLFQGLAARLWSPVIGAVAARGLIPAEAPSDLHWRPAATGPLPLRASATSRWLVLPARGGSAGEDLPAGVDSSAQGVPDGGTSSGGAVPGGGGGSEGAGGAAEVAYRVVVTDLLEPLLGAVREIAGVSVPLLWGNAASSLAGTLRTLPVARPDLGPRAARLVREVLGLGVLAGTGRLAEPAPGWYSFVRVSCCLYYRVPGGGMCDDCALLDPAVREAQWAHAAQRAGEGAGA